MNNFKNFKKFWEKEEPEIVTTSNLEEPGIYRLLQRPMTFKYDKIDLEMIKQFLDEGFNRMGDYKKEMKMNRVELEMQRLRERTGDNYMLNKMVNTDGIEFSAEYTLYKDYDKYFGLTLSGTSINIVDIIEEEFAGLLSSYRTSYRISSTQPKNADSWYITPEENERIREKLYTAQTDSYTPVYNEGNIVLNGNIVGEEDWLHNSSMWGISGITNSKEHLWTETSINTRPDCTNSWTETSTNTGVSTNWTSAPQDIKDVEDRSKAELISKIVADVIEELLTKGTCSLNITLKQE